MNMVLAKIPNYVQDVDFAIWFILIVSFGLLGLITFLMIYFVIKYRREKNPIPTNIPHNTTLEIIWIVIPTIVVMYMFWVGYVGFYKMRNVPENAMNVKVIARMWSFLYEYSNGKKSNELYVPQGIPIKLNLTSQDVLHAFYIPNYKIKEDCVPKKDTYLWFMPDKIGTYKVYCAEYCGTSHSAMISKVHVVPQEDFNKWIKGEPIKLASDPSDTQADGSSASSKGAELFKNNSCLACHSLDGSSSTGPSLAKIWGAKRTVTEKGQEKEITVDEAYLKNAILKPNDQVVKGFQPIMPSSEGLLSEKDVQEIINYLKTQ